jgi:hypothetical protein
VPGRLRSGSGGTFPVRNFAESLFKYRMLLNVASQVIERLPCLFQHAVEFSRALALPSASAICNRAVGVYFAFARDFDWEEDHVLKFIDDPRLNTVRLG